MPAESAVHVFEASHLGHRPFFVAWLLADPPPPRRWVLHATPAVLAHPAVADLLRAPPANLALATLDGCPAEPRAASTPRLLRQQLAKALAVRRSWDRHARPGDVAFIPYGDDLALALAALPWLTLDMPFAMIGMRAGFHQRRQGIAGAGGGAGHRLKEFLLRRLLGRRSARCYLTNQLPLKTDVDGRWGALAAKVRFYPDPAEAVVPVGKEEARRRLGLPVERRYVLSYGSLTARKGVAHLLAALQSPAWPADTAALVAGICRDDVGDRLQAAEPLARRGLLHCFPGFADAERENLLFQAADAVWLVYDGHDGMSGCLVQAGRHRRPAVGCAAGLIGWYVNSSGGGMIYDPARRDASVRALAALLADGARLAACGAGLERAFARHSRDEFRAAIHAGVLGLPDPFATACRP